MAQLKAIGPCQDKKLRQDPGLSQRNSGEGASIGVIACGAVARELVQLGRLNGWTNFRLHCLPADLHNRPQEIPAAVAAKVAAVKAEHQKLIVAYGDCGTAGGLDGELAKLGVERLPGAHCYEFLAGTALFDTLAAEEPGTFFLTDFLVRHFDRLVFKGLGLDRFPQLLGDYFGNYRRALHLSQTGDDQLRRDGAMCAASLGLRFEYRRTGLAPLANALGPLTASENLVWRA